MNGSDLRILADKLDCTPQVEACMPFIFQANTRKDVVVRLSAIFIIWYENI